MPYWGLTPEVRQLQPWGLDEAWLQPGKVITDPIHGDIHITRLEQRVIDSPPFQRLRRVRQLGMTHIVYPSAVHNRFSHMLGTLKVAQDLLDAVVAQRSGLHAVEADLFQQWKDDLPSNETGRAEFDRRVAEATVLVRLGGLFHDLCHVPFGHTIEDDLEILDRHDRNAARFRFFWRHINRDARTAIENAASRAGWGRPNAPRELLGNLLPLILPATVDSSRLDERTIYPFVFDIVGNTICADLLDYLVRDHLFTGLPLALGHRFIDAFYVTRREDPNVSERMVLRTHRGVGVGERPDVVTELLKHLRYRYELSERALVHHAKLAADAMMGKALEMWRDARWFDEAAKEEANRAGTSSERSQGDEAIRIADLRRDDISIAKAELERTWPEGVVTGVSERAKYALERQLRRRGDDAFLEWLHETTREELRKPAGSAGRSTRRAAVAELTRDLLERRLFKQIATVPRSQIPQEPADLYEQHGKPTRRRDLERDAARYAGISDGWKVVVWIPPPGMRLKLIDVLVDDGRTIETFRQHEARTRRGLGEDIYDSHEDLWRISVFVHPSVRDEKKHTIVMARLSEKLGVRLRAPGISFEDEATRWPDRLLAQAIASEHRELAHREDEIYELLRAEVGRRRNDGTPDEDLTHEQRLTMFREIGTSLLTEDTDAS